MSFTFHSLSFLHSSACVLLFYCGQDLPQFPGDVNLRLIESFKISEVSRHDLCFCFLYAFLGMLDVTKPMHREAEGDQQSLQFILSYQSVKFNVELDWMWYWQSV